MQREVWTTDEEGRPEVFLGSLSIERFASGELLELRYQGRLLYRGTLSQVVRDLCPDHAAAMDVGR